MSILVSKCCWVDIEEEERPVCSYCGQTCEIIEIEEDEPDEHPKPFIKNEHWYHNKTEPNGDRYIDDDFAFKKRR